MTVVSAWRFSYHSRRWDTDLHYCPGPADQTQGVLAAQKPQCAIDFHVNPRQFPLLQHPDVQQGSTEQWLEGLGLG